MMTARWKRPLLLARFLFVQRVVGFGRPGEPGLDPDTLACFHELLARSASYLEFGSGGTTLAAARQGVSTLSVEADRFFARAVCKCLPARAPVRILQVSLGITGEWSVPLFRRHTVKRLARWRRYIEAPFEAIDPAQFPDFVLVDGRFRRACILEVARQAALTKAGLMLLVDDYYDPARAHYAAVEKWVGRPKRIGRSALFELSPDAVAPPASAVEEAVRDYR